LLKDEELIKQVNQLDLLKIVIPYSYKVGLNAGKMIQDVAENMETPKIIYSQKDNVISLNTSSG
jgi:hypothetical protein